MIYFQILHLSVEVYRDCLLNIPQQFFSVEPIKPRHEYLLNCDDMSMTSVNMLQFRIKLPRKKMQSKGRITETISGVSSATSGIFKTGMFTR